MAQTLLRYSLERFAGVVTGWDICYSLLYLGEAIAAGDARAVRATLADALGRAQKAHATPVTLDALVTMAELHFAEGDAGTARAVAALVLQHPGGSYEARERAARLVGEGLPGPPGALDAGLTPEQLLEEAAALALHSGTPFPTRLA